MIEVEIKAKLDDPEDVRSRLKKLGASNEGTQFHSDTYYNAQYRDFARTDEALRIRRTDGGSRLTYKGPRLNTISKSRKEIEIEISDPRAADQILTSLGFAEVMTITKRRECYRLDRYTISVDEVNELGYYLEIETITQNENGVIPQVEGIMEVLVKLGMDKNDIITKSYLELILESNIFGT